MSRYRCNSCRGEYSPVCSDGAAYFHVCPPVVDSETLEISPRPDARDENRDPRTGAIKAEGKGRVELDAGTERRPPSPVTAMSKNSSPDLEGPFLTSAPAPEPGKLARLWALVSRKNA